ncbi:type VI secretion system protein ImpK [Lysobacteraceae bacterium NML03-0222]|nr:type VI secretion system protein ImpK [Xanthomonadaceae bacterium NML03-0222]
MSTPQITSALPQASLSNIQAAKALPIPENRLSLTDLMSDGFYMLLMLKRGQLPRDAESFVGAINRFLEGIERQASKIGISNEDIYAAKYAYCAAVDEAMLSQPSALHAEWERNPLQLRLFGEHLAGEHFFDRLEELRQQGAVRLPSLEVYYTCLLLGFEGKYRLEGTEKLGYLTARLGDEIIYLKGKRTGFAPHWPPPDQIRHRLKKALPLWLPALLVGVLGFLGWLGLNHWLGQRTDAHLAQFQDVIQLPEESAHLTITLP